MSVPIGTHNIKKLNDANYESWKTQIKSVLVCNELWKYTCRTEIRTLDNSDVWMSKDEKVLALILLSISKNQLNHVKKATTSHETWEKLKTIYESRGPMRKSVLQATLSHEERTKTKHDEICEQFHR